MHILIGVFLFCFCLSFPSTNSNKTCDEVLKLMEREESEFPLIQKGKSSQSIDNVMSAYHCCEEDMCNDRSHVAASATNAEASLIAAFENSMNLVKDVSKKTTTTITEKQPHMPVPIALVNGRKEFFVNVRNIAPDVFPNTDNTANTIETGVSLPEIRDIATFMESTKKIVSTNNMTTLAVFDTFSSSLMSNTNSTSNETTVTSQINTKSMEPKSTVNTNVAFTEANLMVNTTTTADTETIKNITSSSMDVDFEKNNTITSTMLVANENNNTTSIEIDSSDNSKSLLPTENTYNENNVTSALIDIDVTTTTTSEILNTLTPNTSEVIVSDSNSTMSTPSIIINTTEIITSKTGTEQKQDNSKKFFRVMIRRQDSPRGM